MERPTFVRSIPVLVLVTLLFAGCPKEEPPCNATTCPDGCCTSAGVCQPGNDKAACGTGGLFCREARFSVPGGETAGPPPRRKL